MATQAELQKVVDDTTALAAAARGAWKTAIPSEDAPKMTDDEQAVVDDLEAKFLAAKAARKAAELALREAVDAVAAADEKAKKDAEEAFLAKKDAEEAAAIAAAEAALAKKVAAEAGTPVGSKGLSVLDKKWILTVAGPKGLADPAFAAQVAGPRPKSWKG
jgi:acyl-homoserine lactone acylase PvdQ